MVAGREVEGIDRQLGGNYCRGWTGRVERKSDREGQLLGEALRERRTRLGFSQDGLARAAGIDVKTVRNIEAGRNRPRPSTLRHGQRNTCRVR